MGTRKRFTLSADVDARYWRPEDAPPMFRNLRVKTRDVTDAKTGITSQVLVDGTSPRFPLGSLRAELVYWSKVFGDHCALIAGLLECQHSALINDAQGLLVQWQVFVDENNLKAEAPVQYGTRHGIRADDIDLEIAVGGITFLRFTELLTETKVYKESVLAANPGGLLMDLIPEMLHEAWYCHSKVLRGAAVSAALETQFWDEHTRDHSDAFHACLSPAAVTDKQTSLDAKELAQTLAHAYGGGEDDVTLAWLLSQKVLTYVEQALERTKFVWGACDRLSTTAPDLLLTHTILEIEYGILVLLRLGVPVSEVARSLDLTPETLSEASLRERGYLD